MAEQRRKRCGICKKLTEKWEGWGPEYQCYDGCYSTTGRDRRTADGKPGWEHEWKNLKPGYKEAEQNYN